ncbi:hypothetical protein ACFYU8_17745 [Brevibacillus sp. NPDC003359]|uniref:hypothetical protein n=1 Tax=unclassified Brevibacillus TaxID=2684853 RepID=UPI0036B8EC14
MKKTINQMFTELTDEQMEQAFLENEEWRKTGFLQDGVLRNLHNEFCEENGMNYMIQLMSEHLLYEMVLRYRKELNK